METLSTELIDDGSKRDARGRRLTPPDRIESLLREYEASGLTQAEFARRAGVKYPTFASWIQARRREASTDRPGKATAAPLRFVEACAPTECSRALEIVFADGTRLRGASARELAELAKALRR